MKATTVLTSTLAILAIAGCNPFRSPFRQDPVVEVSKDVNLNLRWNARMASPSELAGVVQIKGAAQMQPGSTSSNTRVIVNIDNASPGGVHPWQVHYGQCGQDGGVFGPPESYQPLKVDNEGKASSATTLNVVMPTDGRYYVSVGASIANPGTIVACGNLAAPSR